MGQTISFPHLLGSDIGSIPGFAEAMSIFTAPFVYKNFEIHVKASLYQLTVSAFSKTNTRLEQVFWNAMKHFFPSEHVLFSDEMLTISKYKSEEWVYTINRSIRTRLRYATSEVPEIVMCRITVQRDGKGHASLAVFLRPPRVVVWTMVTFNLHHKMYMPIEDIAIGLQHKLAPTIIVAAPESVCKDPQGGVGNCVGWSLLFAFYISANPLYMDAPDELLKRINKHKGARRAASELIVEFYFFMCVYAIHIHGVHVLRDIFSKTGRDDLFYGEAHQYRNELRETAFQSICDVDFSDPCDTSGCTMCDTFCVDKRTLQSGCDGFSVRDLLLKMYKAIDMDAMLRIFTFLDKSKLRGKLHKRGKLQWSAERRAIEATASAYDTFEKSYDESRETRQRYLYNAAIKKPDEYLDQYLALVLKDDNTKLSELEEKIQALGTNDIEDVVQYRARIREDFAFGRSLLPAHSDVKDMAEIVEAVKQYELLYDSMENKRNDEIANVKNVHAEDLEFNKGRGLSDEKIAEDNMEAIMELLHESDIAGTHADTKLRALSSVRKHGEHIAQLSKFIKDKASKAHKKARFQQQIPKLDAFLKQKALGYQNRKQKALNLEEMKQKALKQNKTKSFGLP